MTNGKNRFRERSLREDKALMLTLNAQGHAARLIKTETASHTVPQLNSNAKQVGLVTQVYSALHNMQRAPRPSLTCAGLHPAPRVHDVPKVALPIVCRAADSRCCCRGGAARAHDTASAASSARAAPNADTNQQRRPAGELGHRRQPVRGK